MDPVGRGPCVWRFICPSSLVRCFLKSSSLNFAARARETSESGDDGRIAGTGCASKSRVASGEVLSSSFLLAQLNVARPTRIRNDTPIDGIRRVPFGENALTLVEE
jgi:hypothetical protein